MSPIFMVADGMGGHAAGEVASALAIERLSRLAGREGLTPEDVLLAVDEANGAIVDYELNNPETVGMGTTVSGICLGSVFGSPHWFIFNVGDSRVYHFNEGALEQITVDHSEVAELIAAGSITPEQALNHPKRSVITRALGTTPAPIPDVWVLPAIEGERFLICSDGLLLEVSEVAIAERLGRGTSAQVIADELVDAAVAAGGRDNVSVVVVDVLTSEASAEADVTTAPRAGLKDLT